MANDCRLNAADAENVGSTIGKLEVAKVLFKPRFDAESMSAIARAVLNGLRVEPASVTVVANMAQLPPERVKSRATQCWVNVGGELAASDVEMDGAVRDSGYLPTHPATIMLYKRKLAQKFHCFLFRRQGIVDPDDGDKFTHTEKARPLELRLDAGRT